MAAISQTTVSNTFLEWKCMNLIKFSLEFVPKVPVNTIPALVQIMALRRPGAKPLSEPMMVRLLMHSHSASMSTKHSLTPFVTKHSLTLTVLDLQFLSIIDTTVAHVDKTFLRGRTDLLYIDNVVAVDDLATQGTKVYIAMLWTVLSVNILTLASFGLTHWGRVTMQQ